MCDCWSAVILPAEWGTARIILGMEGIPGHGCALRRDVPRPGHRWALLLSLAHAPGGALFLVAPKLSLCSPALSKARPPDPVPPRGRAFPSSGHSTEAVPYFPETCCLPPGSWPPQSWGRLMSWAHTTLSRLDPCSVDLHLARPSWDPHLGGGSHPQRSLRLCEVCSGWNWGDTRWRCGDGHPVRGWARSGLSLRPLGGLGRSRGRRRARALLTSSPQADRGACPRLSLTPVLPWLPSADAARPADRFLPCSPGVPVPPCHSGDPSLPFQEPLPPVARLRSGSQTLLSFPRGSSFPFLFLGGFFLLLRDFLHPLCIPSLAGASFGSLWPW